MLYAPTLVIVAFQEICIHIQHPAVGTVSNAVCIYLVTVFQCQPALLPQECIRLHGQSMVPGVVRIWFKQ